MTTVFGTLDHVLLMAPGPSPVAANVLEAMSLPTLGHLDPDCIKVMDALQEQLRAVCKTRNAVTFPISGTGSAGASSTGSTGRSGSFSEARKACRAAEAQGLGEAGLQIDGRLLQVVGEVGADTGDVTARHGGDQLG